MEIEQFVTSPAAIEEEQPQQQTVTSPAAAQQQTLIGRYLFTAIFYLQLILISTLVIVFTLRGRIFTKSPSFDPKKWYTPLLSSVAVSGVLSLAWQSFFVCNIVATVKATFVVTPLFSFSVGIFLMLNSLTMARLAVGGLILIFSVAQVLYVWVFVLRERREFTFNIMAIATVVLPARTRAIAVVSAILSVLYSGFLVAGIGGATATRTRLDILFISIVVISLAWTMQVLKNVQVVARVEFRNAYDALCATLKNKNQLGSVCIGSTLVPIFVLVRGMIRSINRLDSGSDRTLYASHDNGARIANNLVLYGNRYGFVHVGVHNTGFVPASRDAWQEFRRIVGLEELIDSDITSSICFLSAIATGAISALTAGIWVFRIHKDYLFERTLYAFIIGYFVGRVSSAWLQGCVLAYYVAYSGDPQSHHFDNTIPERIARLDIEEANRLADKAWRDNQGMPIVEQIVVKT